MAEPFATLYTTSGLRHPRTLRILAVAALNNLTLHIPATFTFPTSNKESDYLAKFPLGKIPALETSTGFLLTEASAITYYLARSGPKASQLLGSTNEEMALVQQWISFSESHLYPTVTALVLPRLGMAGFEREVEEEKSKELERWFGYMEGVLEGGKREWLVGERKGPSLADVTLGGTLVLGFKHWIDAEFRGRFPGVVSWFERLVAIDEVKEGFGSDVLIEERKAIV